MKKFTLLLLGLTTCFGVLANTSLTWGTINYQDFDNNDIQLLLTTTCEYQGWCPASIGSNAGPGDYTGWIKISDLKIQDVNWKVRDIFSYLPSNCRMITAPQNLNIIVDSSGNVTSINCPKNK